MRIARAGIVMLAVLGVMVHAQDDKKDKKAKAQQQVEKLLDTVFGLPADLELTDEQKTKVTALKTEWKDKIVEANKKRDLMSFVSPEKKGDVTKARQENKEAKRKGKEAREHELTAAGLSDEDKEKLAAADKAFNELQTKVREEVAKFLTEEQKAKLPKAGKKGKKNKKKDSV